MSTPRVSAIGPSNARIAIVGMAPAREEVAQRLPFVGPAGQILNNSLRALGLSRNDIWIGNVTEQFVAPGTSLFTLSNLGDEVARLKNELQTLQPNVVVPLGEEPLKILCDLNGILKWRGSILPCTLVPGLKCVPSVHPAWIIRGMWKWLPVFTHIDLKRAVAESTTPDINLPERKAITGPSFNTVLDYIEECNKHEILSIDIEVFGHTETGMGEIGCIGIGFEPNQALCIPFVRGGNIHYWTPYEEATIWRHLCLLLQNRDIKKVGQNLSFEWIYFWLHRVYPANMWIDTMLLHHTLYPDFGGTEDVWRTKRTWDEPGHSLAFINSQYTRTPYYKDDGRRRDPRLGDHQWWTYNCKDVMVTLDAALQMHQEALEEGLWDFYCEFHRDVFIHTCRMEWFGVAIDLTKRAKAREDLEKQARELQDRIDQKLGYHLNVNSPKQIMNLLYGRMGLKVKKHKKTKRPTADKATLTAFAEKTQDEVLLWIQELRSILDLKGDLIDQPLGADGRMHTHYKQGGTDTNRWSSTKSILGTGTNLQNIPVKGVARQLFIPDGEAE